MTGYAFCVIVGVIFGLIAARNPVVSTAVEAGISELKSWFER